MVLVSRCDCWTTAALLELVLPVCVCVCVFDRGGEKEEDGVCVRKHVL
jgi:hypothetical protein